MRMTSTHRYPPPQKKEIPDPAINDDESGNSSSSTDNTTGAADNKKPFGENNGNQNAGDANTDAHNSEDSSDRENVGERHKPNIEKKDEDEEADKEGNEDDQDQDDELGIPGRVVIKTPPKYVQTPMVAIGSKLNLEWTYDENLARPPKKYSFRLQLPKQNKNQFQGERSPALMFDIAQNVTTEVKSRNNLFSFEWDLAHIKPSDFGLQEGKGYFLHMYDGDLGFSNSDAPPAGRMQKFTLPIAFYNSRYEQTNEGVPKNYNPNAAVALPPHCILYFNLLVMVSLELAFFF
ncbi:hypothetical protein AX774_g3403 [Zancudomyces culisetae]|uniref:DUF7137 domain-containing protein n=1 Tax=Zancudomyces culisetae TaxID=1213189 RepID=A0A1R1PQ55_ZANCU|nr:hypothetical protein AX774_g3403 [Zancudomyces culisetae]|eukprot:OMH83094.1 hypothetical protein AX774_g3403 [Zancudomyces culisetae]